MSTAAESMAPAEERIVKLGLLMEAAVAYQRAAEEALNKLKAHTQGIDAIVRDEIRRTLVDEFLGLGAECKRATQALHGVKRAANLYVALWSVGVTAICITLALGVLWWQLPSKAEIHALRAEYERYAEAVAQLEQRGGRIDLRRCGDSARLCVRVDLEAPAFGAQRDYFIVRPTSAQDKAGWGR